MNTKFILPAGLALTLHAFLLFGLPGETPVAPSLPEPLPVDDKLLPVYKEDPIRVAKTDEDSPPNPDGPVAPRRADIPIAAPGGDVFLIPTLPPIPGSPTIAAIPAGWERPRDLGTGVNLRVVDGMDLDCVPRARLQPAPDYPYSMRSRRVEGTVVVEFLVDEAGNVYSSAVLRATNPGFEEAALRAVARWKFESGYKDGRKVRFRMSVPVVFRISAG
jgi:protein TonB